MDGALDRASGVGRLRQNKHMQSEAQQLTEADSAVIALVRGGEVAQAIEVLRLLASVGVSHKVCSVAAEALLRLLPEQDPQ